MKYFEICDFNQRLLNDTQSHSFWKEPSSGSSKGRRSSPPLYRRLKISQNSKISQWSWGFPWGMRCRGVIPILTSRPLFFIFLKFFIVSIFLKFFIFLRYGNIFFICFCVVVIFSLLISYFKDSL